MSCFCLCVQILGTMLLLLCVCAITDKKNTQVPSSLVPMYVGFTILGIGVCFGANCGYALNPARDLAPRLLSLIAGWSESFRFVYILAPLKKDNERVSETYFCFY